MKYKAGFNDQDIDDFEEIDADDAGQAARYYAENTFYIEETHYQDFPVDVIVIDSDGDETEWTVEAEVEFGAKEKV